MNGPPFRSVLFATAFVAGLGLVVEGQQPAFRSAVDLVSLNLTVTDPAGRYGTDLPLSL